MTIFITQGRYTQEAIKGMMAKPEDREAAARQLIEKAGGKLLAFYMTFGEYDWLCVSEGEPEGMAAIVITGSASGAVTDVKTMLAMTASDMRNAFTKAGTLAASFKHPGRQSAPR
jgi:uncharacterized protein with GYD domain